MENGFYKLMDEYTICSGTKLVNNNYSIDLSNKDSFEFPVDGWYYFDSPENAIEFFDIVPSGVSI
jgi:hypothetical protein